MTNLIEKNKKRAKRIRRKLNKINSDRFRLTVFRSAKNISAQIIDKKAEKTLVSASSFSKKKSNIKKKGFVCSCSGDFIKEGFREKNYKCLFW